MLVPHLLLLASCDPSGDDGIDPDSGTDSGLVDPTGDPATVPLLGYCPLETQWGEFIIEAYDNYSIVDGQASNGVVPATVLELAAAEGDCRLLKRNNPYCDPTCGPGFTCDFDGTCVVYPEAQDLGSVRISGLVEDVVMEPLAPTYQYFNTKLAHPAFLPGALVEMVTTGGAFAPVMLHAVGVDLLEPTSLLWEVAAGSALAVSWDSPVGAVRSSVDLSLNIDQHGITPVTLQCSFQDTGTAVVPASVLDALFAFGVSGYPSANLARRTVDSAPLGEGCIDLALGHEVLVDVTVGGHTPCGSTADCPDGQECNLAIQTCQ